VSPTADGELWCVAKASLGSYDCAVVYNRDASISGTSSQFACLVNINIILIKYYLKGFTIKCLMSMTSESRPLTDVKDTNKDTYTFDAVLTRCGDIDIIVMPSCNCC
jgi:hypothetical protein